MVHCVYREIENIEKSDIFDIFNIFENITIFSSHVCDLDLDPRTFIYNSTDRQTDIITYHATFSGGQNFLRIHNCVIQ